MKKREKAHARAKATGTDEAWGFFRELRNKVVSTLRQAKSDFYCALSNKITKLKDFWSSYRSLTKEYRRVPHQLSRGSCSATTSLAKASLLNEQFFSHFTPVSASLPSPLASRKPCQVLSTITCTSGDVLGVLQSMKPKVASGPDGISSPVLRGCSASICSPLSELFNLSLTSGRVPVDWKLSNVTPIFKSGDEGQATNYRPISLLSLTWNALFTMP